MVIMLYFIVCVIVCVYECLRVYVCVQVCGVLKLHARCLNQQLSTLLIEARSLTQYGAHLFQLL